MDLFVSNYNMQCLLIIIDCVDMNKVDGLICRIKSYDQR